MVCDITDAWAHVDRVVARSGTSFLWGMRILPPERRKAMLAIYAFCREVDDIADGFEAVTEKRKSLAEWREEIARLYDGQPKFPTTQALLTPVRQMRLPRDEFLAVIAGMDVDAASSVRMRSMNELLSYCRKVAGAVGMLSIHAFGASSPPGPKIAETLGNALQLTNILRDLREDAARNRLYVPLDMLEDHGVSAESLEDILVNPGFAEVCGKLSQLARKYYAEAGGLIASYPGRAMRPAAVMMATYRETLDQLEQRGWHRTDLPVRVNPMRKVWLAVRYGFL